MAQGGYWAGKGDVGVTYRFIIDSSNAVNDTAASGRRHLEMFIYYTDFHDVDEDRMVISGQGAIWFGIGIHVGVMCRVLNASSGDISDGVASLKK